MYFDLQSWLEIQSLTKKKQTQIVLYCVTHLKKVATRSSGWLQAVICESLWEHIYTNKQEHTTMQQRNKLTRNQIIHAISVNQHCNLVALVLKYFKCAFILLIKHSSILQNTVSNILLQKVSPLTVLTEHLWAATRRSSEHYFILCETFQ